MDLSETGIFRFALMVVALWGSVVVVNLFMRVGRRLGRWALATLILCLAILISRPLELTRDSLLYWPLCFLIGPLYYAYVILAMRKGRMAPVSGIHFVPAAVAAMYLAILHLVPGAVETPAELRSLELTTMVGALLHMAFYLFLMFVASRDYFRKLRERLAAADITLRDVYRSTTLTFGIYLAVTCAVVLALAMLGTGREWVQNGADAVAALFLISLAVVGLRPLARALDPERLDVEPPRRMRVAENEAPERIQALTSLMESDELYLQRDLRLYDVATRLGTTTHELSELLNHHLDTTFHDFVNGYRVRHAARRLNDPGSNELTLAAIAEESGFSSKSSFNRAFKKVTGLTPSQYQKRLPGRMDTGGGAASVL